MPNQAYIKIYKDMACTKELGKGLDDSYVINVNVPTGHSSLTLKHNIYIKNVGTYKAYNIALTKTFDSSNKSEIIFSCTALDPGRSARILLTAPYSKGEKSNYTIGIHLEYDNIP